MPTKEELEAENERLRAEISALHAMLDERDAADNRVTEVAAPAPSRPSFGLSEGERADLESRGVTNSPWTGEQLNAVDQGIDTASEEAEERAVRANAAAEKARAAAGPGA